MKNIRQNIERLRTPAPLVLMAAVGVTACSFPESSQAERTQPASFTAGESCGDLQSIFIFKTRSQANGTVRLAALNLGECAQVYNDSGPDVYQPIAQIPHLGSVALACDTGWTPHAYRVVVNGRHGMVFDDPSELHVEGVAISNLPACPEELVPVTAP